MKDHILGGLQRAVEDVIYNPGTATELALDGAIAAYQKARTEEEPAPTARAQKILDVADDLVSKFLYYDRKESESLPLGEIEAAIRDGEISVDEIVQVFRDGLEKHVARGS